jgi:hypothetical protein
MGVQTMRRVLGRVGTDIRQRGGRKPAQPRPDGEPWGDTFVNRPTAKSKAPRPTVPKVYFPKRDSGHRRRGRNL